MRAVNDMKTIAAAETVGPGHDLMVPGRAHPRLSCDRSGDRSLRPNTPGDGVGDPAETRSDAHPDSRFVAHSRRQP